MLEEHGRDIVILSCMSYAIVISVLHSFDIYPPFALFSSSTKLQLHEALLPACRGLVTGLFS